MIQSCRICSLNNVSQWGTWEVAREIISNSIDADPKYILNFIDTHSFDVYTSTAPTYAECASIGESSKTYGGSTIGQFGEGLKVAAATAARLGGQIIVSTPAFRGRYLIRNEEGFRHPSLWLEIEDPSQRCAPLPTKGCTISVSVPSANFQQYQSRFIPPASTLIPKPECGKATIYCKGVWIGQVHYISRYDYNLDFEINRDRNVNSSSSAIYSAAYRTLANLPSLPEDILTAFFSDPDSVEFELQALNYAPYSSTQHTTPIGLQLQDKAFDLYGNKPAIIDAEATPDQIQEAIRQGYHPISVVFPSFLNFPKVSKIRPPARPTPSRFTPPPPAIKSFISKSHDIFSSLSIKPPVILCVEDDDSSRPLIWEHDDHYYYTVGRGDNPLESFFAIYSAHLDCLTTNRQAADCGINTGIWAAARLYAALV